MAKAMRNYKRPPALNTLEPPLASIDTSSELSLQVTKILANQLSVFKLTNL